MRFIFIVEHLEHLIHSCHYVKNTQKTIIATYNGKSVSNKVLSGLPNDLRGNRSSRMAVL